VPRFSSGRHQIRSPRRLTAWSEGTGGTGDTTVSTTAPAFVGAVITAVVEGITLIRMRGYVQMWLTSATAGGDGLTGAFGIGIASTAAVAAGIASVPTPITDQAAENWLYWQGFTVRQIGATEVGSNEGLWRAEIDSKAMRKTPGDVTVYAAVEVGAVVGAAAMIVSHDSRALAKLP